MKPFKEHPIPFSAPMVQAILAGRKTQTRRVVKPIQSDPRCLPPRHMAPYMWGGVQERDGNGLPCWIGTHPNYPTGVKWFSCPYGGLGDRLWIRETYACPDGDVLYRADGDIDPRHWRWHSPRYMPRSASRILLEITHVRVEHLQDITEADIQAEGLDIAPNPYDEFTDGFQSLWDRINGKHYPWRSNPWVWVITFNRVSQL